MDDVRPSQYQSTVGPSVPAVTTAEIVLQRQQDIPAPKMTHSLLSETTSCASYDRQDEWRKCCAVAMGFEWVDRFEEDETDDNDRYKPIQQVINLLEDDGATSDDESFQVENANRDHWTENALRIQADLIRMTQWIRNKQYDFVSVEMPDDEASLIQSTITSFTATTASELETLRKMITSSSNIASHRAGVVQILLTQLKEQVAEPFGSLQKQRMRVAVQLWQNPLQCRLYQPNQNKDQERVTMMQMLDEQDQVEREQRFLPRREGPLDDCDFLAKYRPSTSAKLVSRPAFISQIAQKKRRLEVPRADTVKASSDDKTIAPAMGTPKRLPMQPQAMSYKKSEESRQQRLDVDLQQEAALLTVAVQNDLDTVKQMEQNMVNITTLISQFSNLVTEQQEEIWQIHDAAENTKDNMEKGQENLVDAAERTKRSKHYMAWSVFAMAVTLLFFHTLRN
jgi:hypothetical protein